MIFLCMALGAGDVLANLFGYTFGFIISFILNGKWTFRRSALSHMELGLFIFVTCLAYLVNLSVMLLMRDRLGWTREMGQLSGVVAYTLVGFIGMKYLTFRVVNTQQGNGGNHGR